MKKKNLNPAQEKLILHIGYFLGYVDANYPNFSYIMNFHHHNTYKSLSKARYVNKIYTSPNDQESLILTKPMGDKAYEEIKKKYSLDNRVDIKNFIFNEKPPKKFEEALANEDNIHLPYKDKLNFILLYNIIPADFDPEGYCYNHSKYGCIYKDGDSKLSISLGIPYKPEKPELRDFKSSEEAMNYAQELKRWEEDIISYEERYSHWLEFKEKVDELWKKRFLEYYRLTKHPKKDTIFEWVKKQDHQKSLSLSYMSTYMERGFKDLFQLDGE